METKSSLALFSLFVFLAGCASLQTGGEVQSGRQALLKGRNETALGYFYSAAQRDPDYVYATGSSPKQGVWSYVGRSEYLTGRFPEARQTLERAIAIQSTRRYRQALFRSDLGPRRRSTARPKRNRKRDARH